MIKLLYILALATGVHARAEAVRVEAAIGRLMQIMAPRVHRLERPLVTFTYQQRKGGPDDFEPETMADVVQRLYGRADRFYDITLGDGNMQGPGIYVAADPVNSRGYGFARPHLFVITLKAEARVLSLARSLSDEERSDVVRIVREFKCSNDEFGDLEDITEVFRNSQSLTCRHLITESFRRLNVDATMFAFTSPTDFEGCRGTRDEALNIISSRAIAFDQLAFFSNEHRFGPEQLAALTKALYARAASDPFADPGDHPEMPATLATFTAPADHLDAWTSERILGCGPARAVESEFVSGRRWTNQVKRRYRDVESQLLIRKVQKAFQSKFNNFIVKNAGGATTGLRFGLDRLVWLQHLTYRAASMRPNTMSLADWREATQVLSNYSLGSSDQLAPASTLLGEDVTPFARYAPNQLQPITDAVVRRDRTFSLLAIMREIQLSRRASLILANRFIIEQHGTPYLYSITNQRDDAQALHESRLTLRKVLETCLAIYEDANATPAEIQRGQCGIDPASVNW